MSTAAPPRPHARDARWLPDGGLIDDLAVSLTVAGARLVRLTEAERDLAVSRMIGLGADVQEIADHLGTNPATATRLVKALGYRLSAPDRSKHRWIVSAARAAVSVSVAA